MWRSNVYHQHSTTNQQIPGNVHYNNHTRIMRCEYLPTQAICPPIRCLKIFHNTCTTCPADQQKPTSCHFTAQWSLHVPPGLTFRNPTFCPHSVFMCFVWIWEKTAIISLYSINWLVFITETECVYCAVRTGSLYTASLTFSNSTFCPHSEFMCFVWIWEQTAIISLYSIKWLIFWTET